MSCACRQRDATDVFGLGVIGPVVNQLRVVDPQPDAIVREGVKRCSPETGAVKTPVQRADHGPVGDSFRT